MTNSTCPYCGAVFEKEPQRNFKCKACGNELFVRKKSNLYGRLILTESEKLVEDAFETLSTNTALKVDIEYFTNTKKELSKKFGKEADWLDVVWAVYNKLAMEYAKIGNFELLSYIYEGQASFLWQSKKDFSVAKKESIRYKLMNYKHLGAKSARIIAYPYDCIACESFDGKNVSLMANDNLLPLPPEECTCILDKKLERGYCICELAANF